MDASAFSLLAAPLAAPAVPGGPDPAKLIGFFAQEMQLFFQHIQAAVATYTETGTLPSSIFTQKQVRGVERQATAGKERKEKGKRRPTAFNLFVKEKLEEFKQRGVKDPNDNGTNNGLFKMAVAEWGKLSDVQKQAYQEKYGPVIEAMREDGEEHEEHEEHALPQLAGEGGGFMDSLTADSPKKKKTKTQG